MSSLQWCKSELLKGLISISIPQLLHCLKLGNARQLVYCLAEQILLGLDILLKHSKAFLNPTSLGNRSCSGLEMWYPICVHHCPQGETVICPKNLNHEPTTTAKPFYQSIQDGQNGGLLLGRNTFYIALLMLFLAARWTHISYQYLLEWGGRPGPWHFDVLLFLLLVLET